MTEQGVDVFFPNIMFINKDALTQGLMINMLKTMHCGDIMVFEEPTQALRTLQENVGYFDIVISDSHFRNMSCTEFLKTFRSMDNTTPVLMVTGKASRDLLIEAIKAGVNDCLATPFGRKDLLTKVQKLIQDRRESHKSVAANVC